MAVEFTVPGNGKLWLYQISKHSLEPVPFEMLEHGALYNAIRAIPIITVGGGDFPLISLEVAAALTEKMDMAARSRAEKKRGHLLLQAGPEILYVAGVDGSVRATTSILANNNNDIRVHWTGEVETHPVRLPGGSDSANVLFAKVEVTVHSDEPQVFLLPLIGHVARVKPVDPEDGKRK